MSDRMRIGNENDNYDLKVNADGSSNVIQFIGGSAVAVANPIPTTAIAATANTGGCLTYRRISTADTNLAVIKNAAGRIYGVVVLSKKASACYVKLYDKASNPTLASDTPLMTFLVPATGQVALTWTDIGCSCANGIAMAATGAIGDTDTTNLVAADIIVQINYA